MVKKKKKGMQARRTPGYHVSMWKLAKNCNINEIWNVIKYVTSEILLWKFKCLLSDSLSLFRYEFPYKDRRFNFN